MNYIPTYASAVILLIIYTAQLIAGSTSRSLIYFIALILFIALINLLFGDRPASVIAGLAALVWLLAALLTPTPAKPATIPRCSSSAPPPPPTTFEPTYECQQCNGTSDTIDCIDLKL